MDFSLSSKCPHKAYNVFLDLSQKFKCDRKFRNIAANDEEKKVYKIWENAFQFKTILDNVLKDRILRKISNQYFGGEYFLIYIHIYYIQHRIRYRKINTAKNITKYIDAQ